MTNAGEGQELPPLHGVLMPRGPFSTSLYGLGSLFPSGALSRCALMGLSRMEPHLGSSAGSPFRTQLPVFSFFAPCTGLSIMAGR